MQCLPNEPLVEPSMPGSPESLEIIIIEDASVHIFRNFHVIPKRPAARILP